TLLTQIAGWPLSTTIFSIILMPAAAQDIERVDHFAIQRGKQIAEACFHNRRPGMLSDYLECTQAAIHQISDNLVLIGLLYYRFVTEGLTHETIREDNQIPLF